MSDNKSDQAVETRERRSNRRSVIVGAAGALLGLGLSGCGGSGGTNQNPATRLARFSAGAFWRYRIYPRATKDTFIWTDIYYLTPGDPRITAFGMPESLNQDAAIPGALIRINQVTPFDVTLPTTRAYGGTFRQDDATRNLYLLRLPSGALLDTPVLILPGDWSSSTSVTSPLVTGGQNVGSYSLTVTGVEETELKDGGGGASRPVASEVSGPDGADPKFKTWKTSVFATGVMAYLSGTFWYAPEIGSFIQMIPVGVQDIDRKIQNYTLYS